MKVIKVAYKELPELKITNSFSYNEKMALLRGKKIDVLAIGSSVTLDNLNSNEVVKEFNTNSFFNAASFGLSNIDIYKFIKSYNSIYKPKKIIVVGSINDFFSPDKTINYNDLTRYLTTSTYNELWLTKFDPRYTITEIANKKKYRDTSIHSNTDNLLFDNYGGVLNKKYPIGEDLRKNFKERVVYSYNAEYSSNKDVYYKNLSYLDSISIYCKNNEIELYYFPTPYDQVYLTDMNEMSNLLNKLFIDEQKIFLTKGQHFVKTNSVQWNDSLFVDYVHMNEVGSKIFTRFCLDQCK